jgi:hypothetical protein
MWTSTYSQRNRTFRSKERVHRAFQDLGIALLDSARIREREHGLNSQTAHQQERAEGIHDDLSRDGGEIEGVVWSEG